MTPSYMKFLEKYLVHVSILEVLVACFSSSSLFIFISWWLSLRYLKLLNASLYANSTFMEPVLKRIVRSKRTMMQTPNQNLVNLRTSL